MSELAAEIELEIKAWVEAVELVQEMRLEEERLMTEYEPIRVALSHQPKTEQFRDLCRQLNIIRRTIGEHELILGLRDPGMITVKNYTE